MKWPIIFALMTGFFWGTYGPALGLARAAEQNPFKPYLMIGLAYLVWAVLGGFGGIAYTGAKMQYSGTGATWGFIAGSLGAFGALTLTLAMFSFSTGMKPRADIVMPIVFGTAVSVTAIVSVIQTKAAFNPYLYMGIAGMAVCIVTVAYNTPHAAPHKPAAPTTTPESAGSDKPAH
ncbi:MAG: hypothetical protein KF777_23650 [Planctomycetaceae bacterium]|nr:hypothetical protein [Planctomycetaceae bacterium]